ncbi:MAG: CvpA family protein [Pseudomonadota bacterium]
MTWFDFLILGALALSVGFAAVRGAIREGATLLALAISGFATFLLYGPLMSAFGLTGSFFGMIALIGVLGVVLFLIVYTAFHIGLGSVRLSGRNVVIDRAVGGVFGLLRGLALIGLSFLGYAYYLDEDNRPPSINGAMLLPVAQASASFFEGLAPQRDAKQIISADELERRIDVSEDGYAPRDQNALDEIVVTTTTSSDESVDGGNADTSGGGVINPGANESQTGDPSTGARSIDDIVTDSVGDTVTKGDQ